MMLGTQTVTVWRPGPPTEDELHNEIPGDPEPHTIAGCSVQPGAGSEYVIDRSSTTTVYTVWAPASADVLDDDRVEFAGVRYYIDGPVQRWAVGTTLDHLVIPLRSTKG